MGEVDFGSALQVAHLVVTILLFLYVRVTKSHAATADQIAAIDKRVTALETGTENAPDHDDLQKLHDRISSAKTDLSGEIEAVADDVAKIREDMGEVKGELAAAIRLVELLNRHQLKEV